MYQINHADLRHFVPTIPVNSIDAVVTDPPYNLTGIRKRCGANSAPIIHDVHKRTAGGFMGKEWDSAIAFDPEIWRLIYDVMKPGAHLVAFAGDRTHHRMWCAIEDAGFEIRQSMVWVYGSGFPKSHNIGDAIAKELKAPRIEVEPYPAIGFNKTRVEYPRYDYDLPVEAQKYKNFGTALKPAIEMICLARKPLGESSVAKNVLKYGSGALNIDGCRVGQNGGTQAGKKIQVNQTGVFGTTTTISGTQEILDNGKGRWPANFLHDGSDEVLALFPESKSCTSASSATPEGTIFKGRRSQGHLPMDSGSAARFFYCAKSSPAERELGLHDMARAAKAQWKDDGHPHRNSDPVRANTHPTVKPLALMRYLCRLITPPHGLILDPFTGSGSTGVAAIQEDFDFLGCELEAEYAAIAEQRLAWAEKMQRSALTE